MINTRWIKTGLVLAAVLVVIGASLAWMVEPSAAQGPGRRGNGRGGNGLGLQNQDGTGQQFGGNSFSAKGQNGFGNAQQNRFWLTQNLPPATPGDLPDDVIAALTAGIQDEYNAYAIYQAVIDQFGAVRPFTNIQSSEAHHVDMLAFLFERYGLNVPTAVPLDPAPVFASVQDACAAAAEAENAGLYDAWITTAQNYPDIVHVFTMLRDASKFQHLPVFERCAG